MTTPRSIDNPSEHRPARPPRNRVFGCAASIGGLLTLAILIFGGVWFYATRRANEQLAIQVAKVRARGEPLTTVDLNDYYQPAKNRPDMTKEIMAALAICDAPERKETAIKLPIVGQGAEIPPPPNSWPQLEEVEAYLARVTFAFDKFRDVTRREGTVRFPIDFSPGIATLLPQAQSMRQCSRVLSLQFHVHLHRGRTSDAVDCILDQIALARVLEHEPILISQLVRLAFVAMAVSHVQDVVRLADVSDADLVRLQQGLRKLEFQACLTRALAGERAIGYTACIDPTRMAEGAAPVTPAEARVIAQRAPSRFHIHDATKMLEFSLRIAEAGDQSLFAALQESKQFDAERRMLSLGMFSKFRYMMTLMMSPAYRQAITSFARGAARRDTADVAIAAELYRRRHGKWPENLEQLVPEYLPAVPYDSFNNQPLKMVSTAKEFKVYSVGKDGTDDHGNLAADDKPNTDTGFAIPARAAE